MEYPPARPSDKSQLERASHTEEQMNWQQIAGFILRHTVLCIIFPALVMTQVALILVAFRTCSCEQCGKPFGIWRCRDRVLELCYSCYRERRPQRRKLLASASSGQTVSSGQTASD